jgi:hypothetical protein
LIGHGYTYSPPQVKNLFGFYAAAVFNDHNPWWMVMPEVTRYYSVSVLFFVKGSQ